jgi:uncharacterized membrane protein
MVRARAHLLSRVARDRRGAIAPMMAVMGTVLVGAAGMALDAGLYYVGNRSLQAATEAAALSAASLADNPSQAAVRARAILASNGYGPTVLKSVEVGRYCADGRAGVAAASRFDLNGAAGLCPGNGIRTAVRLHTESPSRQYLSKVLGSIAVIPALSGTATAARIDEAGLGITSGVVSVSGGLVGAVNDLLGALLGIKLTLNATQVGTLMNSNIDAGRFFDKLAERVGETGTYSDLTARSVPLSDILAAGADAATADGNSATAVVLTAVAAQVGSGYSVPLNGLFGLGVWKNMPVGDANSAAGLRAGLNAYQLLAFAIQGGSGKVDLSDTISRVVSGSTLSVAGVATGPVERPRFSFGPAGETQVGTSALRLQIKIGVGDISVPLLLLAPIKVESVPVLIDVAAATAEIRSISCGEEARTDTAVTVRANSGLVNAYIGEGPANAMTSPMPAITAANISAAHIVNVANILTVDARAVAQPVLGNTRDVVFGSGGAGTIGTPPAAGTAVSIGNGSQVGPLLTSLNSNLALDIRLLKLCLPLVCSDSLLTAGIRSSLTDGIVTPIAGIVSNTADPLVDNLLGALGIQLGNATMWVTGARCGVPVLV